MGGSLFLHGLENWLRDKKERVEINGCLFKWRTSVPQELVLFGLI